MARGDQRARRIVAAAAIASLVVAVAMLLRQTSASGARSRPAADAPRRAEAARARAPRAPSAPAPSVAAGGAVAIAGVTVEKSEVCRGEQNLVTVEVATTDGSDPADVRTLVSGVAGRRVPVLGLADGDGAGPSSFRQVVAIGPDGSEAVAEVPAFLVKDCAASHILSVSASRLPNSDSQLELRATIAAFDGAIDPFDAVLYRWDFGDGETQETMEAIVEHSYDGRAQDALYSHFLVTVEAMDANGRTVTGRHPLELANAYVHNQRVAGVVVLRVAMTPRVAAIDERGVVEQTFRVWHHEPAPVAIDRIVEITQPLASRAGGDAPEPTERVLSPGAVLPARAIPPEGTTLALAIDTIAEPTVAFRTYRLEGRSAGGLPVHGVLSVMRPPPSPTPDDHVPVADDVLKEKIRRTMDLLGKETVTGDDIRLLERAGAFADLGPSNPYAGYARAAWPAQRRH